MTLLGALDVGSNTIRLLVARPVGDGLQTVMDLSDFVRLGAGVAETGELEPDRMERGIRVIRDFAAAAHGVGVKDIAAVGTSALREARNGQEFVDRVARETGIQVKIIAGETEARLTFLGLTLGHTLESPTIAIDVGGGSGEVIAAGPAGMLWAHALPIGSGRMTERFFVHDPPTESERKALIAHIDDILRGLPSFRAKDAIVTGGSARRIPILLDSGGIPAHLTPQDLQRAMEILSARPARDIARHYAIDLDRACVLAAGVQVIQAIAEFYGVESITVTDNGIRQGMIIEMLREGKSA